jgi:threonine dehydrogenase-like Zn-dependent dehydrogenase
LPTAISRGFDIAIAVWGCGPVGQFAIKSAYLLGAERVIAIDRFPARLRMAREKAGAETLNYEGTSVLEALREMTGGRGPDACIDAVGMEAHTPGLMHTYHRAKQAVMLETDRPVALREAIMACRNGGTVSRAEVLTTSSGADTETRDRPELRHHASHAPGRRAGGLRKFLEKDDDCIKIVPKPH